jgi:hypothetical protein
MWPTFGENVYGQIFKKTTQRLKIDEAAKNAPNLVALISQRMHTVKERQGNRVT